MNKQCYKIACCLLICYMVMIFYGCQQIQDDNSSVDINPIGQGKEGDTMVEPQPSPTIVPVSPSSTMFVKMNQYDSSLNVRDNPTTQGNIIGSLRHGDSVKIIAAQTGWVQIQHNETIGYVNADYLSNEKPEEILPPTRILPPTSSFTDGISGVVSLKVYKERRILELWKGDTLVDQYRIALGFAPMGHKEKEGDGRTPEGSYYICMRNPNSRFYLSLGVSYPGIPDAEKGLASGLITQRDFNNIRSAINSADRPPWNTPLGGEIMIHGGGSNYDWTAGCIAVDNSVMDILWELCTMRTKVDIYP